MNKIVFLTSLMFLVLLSQSSCIKQKLDAEVVEIVSPTTEDLNDVLFVSDSIGFICGGTKYSKGIILKTKDAGTTWTQDTFEGIKALYDMEYHDNQIFTTGNEGYLFVSSNYGNTWYEPGSPYWDRFNQIAFNDLGEIFVGMGEGFDKGEIVFSNNNANSWTRVDTFIRSIKSIVFHHGIGFAGAYGIIYKSLDQGHTWIPIDTKGDFFNQIIFINDQIGYAIGYFGMILKTTDGGNSWNKILNENFSFSEKSNFRDAYFIDENTGYVIGDKGYMIYTKDGGKKWNIINKFTDADLYAIEKVNDYFIIVAASGKIFKMNRI